jgi:hypothetical protein
MKRDLTWLSAAVAGGEPPEMIADWLSDTGHDLAGVLHLFAGCPPRWTQGIGVQAVACWLEATGEPRAESVRRDGYVLPPTPPHYAGRQEFWGYLPAGVATFACPDCGRHPGRLQGTVMPVRDHPVRPPGDLRTPLSGSCNVCGAWYWAHTEADRWPDVRAMKRRVLAHFPDVYLTRLEACDCTLGVYWRGGMRCTGMKDCKGLGFYKPGGTAAAPLLIPEQNP